MKKLFAILITLVLVTAISACNNKGGDTAKNNTTSKSQQKTEQKDSTKLQSDKLNESQGDQPQSDNNLITRDRAIELALNHAGLSKTDLRDLEAELDRERNGTFWEVDFEHGGYDYSYDINAETEEVFKLEKERD